jgi:hypothetical protein
MSTSITDNGGFIKVDSTYSIIHINKGDIVSIMPIVNRVIVETTKRQYIFKVADVDEPVATTAVGLSDSLTQMVFGASATTTTAAPTTTTTAPTTTTAAPTTTTTAPTTTTLEPKIFDLTFDETFN